jgi:hypothetical protein
MLKRLLPLILLAAFGIAALSISNTKSKHENAARFGNAQFSASLSAASSILTVRRHSESEASFALGIKSGDAIVPLQGHGESFVWQSNERASLRLTEDDRVFGILHVSLHDDVVELSVSSIPSEQMRAPIALVLTALNVREAEARPASKITLLRTDLAVVLASPSPFTVEPEESASRIESTDVLFLSVDTEARTGLAYGPALAALRMPHARVEGKVTTAGERATAISAKIRGFDLNGMLLVETTADAHGSFMLDAPKDAVTWTATYGASTESAEARFVPGESPGQLNLDASPGALLTVKVRDPDASAGKGALTARVIIRGTFGTLDPSFGPDYRSSGAGPLADTLRGEFTTTLAPGKYSVLASKGIEWSIDKVDVELKSGAHETVTLEPRHAVPSEGLVGCDLHVHARPSFDTLVTAEDRVLSLVAAGVDFAVPTEHNVVGDYTAPLRFLELTDKLAFVPGVEVTPFAPRFGHFGVFPWSTTAAVPPFRKTTPSAIFNTVKRDGDPDRVLQVNHPRMEKQIGYFEVERVDTKSGAHEMKARMDFDAIEVLNGFEMGSPQLVERNIVDYTNLLNLGRHYVATGSSDSHRILYGWAGYPRTYAMVSKEDGGDTGRRVDPMSVVRAIKHGRAFVSAGPLLSFSLSGKGPGEVLLQRPASAHLEVRAAPWVDVRTVDILVDGRIAFHKDLPAYETVARKEEGSIAELQKRSLRFSEDIALTLTDRDRWAIAIVRGEESLERYLPATPIKPIAFTNPIWLAPR